MIALEPLGDRAFLARFKSEAEARRWESAVRRWSADEPGIVDVVLAYRSAAVFANPDRIDLDRLAESLRLIDPDLSESSSIGRLIELPVLYDGDDLTEVANLLGLAVDDVIRIHSGTVYHVFAIGFLPGFPYAGYLPAMLAGLPRRSTPRTRVPSGSVAIAGRQTGVYPQVSPGGWHLLGRTPLRIADLSAEHFPIMAGDRLKFVAIDPEEFRSLEGRWLERNRVTTE